MDRWFWLRMERNNAFKSYWEERQPRIRFLFFDCLRSGSLETEPDMGIFVQGISWGKQQNRGRGSTMPCIQLKSSLSLSGKHTKELPLFKARGLAIMSAGQSLAVGWTPRQEVRDHHLTFPGQGTGSFQPRTLLWRRMQL